MCDITFSYFRERCQSTLSFTFLAQKTLLWVHNVHYQKDQEIFAMLIFRVYIVMQTLQKFSFNDTNVCSTC